MPCIFVIKRWPFIESGHAAQDSAAIKNIWRSQDQKIRVLSKNLPKTAHQYGAGFVHVCVYSGSVHTKDYSLAHESCISEQQTYLLRQKRIIGLIVALLLPRHCCIFCKTSLWRSQNSGNTCRLPLNGGQPFHVCGSSSESESVKDMPEDEFPKLPIECSTQTV